MTKTTKSDLEILDDVYAEAATVETEQHAPRSRWSRDVAESYRVRIAELRRSRLPATVPTAKAKPIPASLLAMARDALQAILGNLARTHGDRLQWAHRNLKGLSDDDLRRLIVELQPDAE